MLGNWKNLETSVDKNIEPKEITKDPEMDKKMDDLLGDDFDVSADKTEKKPKINDNEEFDKILSDILGDGERTGVKDIDYKINDNIGENGQSVLDKLYEADLANDKSDFDSNEMENDDKNKEDLEEEETDGDSEKNDVNAPKSGGRYRDVKNNSNGETHEVHHMPADSAYEILDRNDGPAIKMEKADHRETASCGNSNDSRDYRQQQRGLIEQGKFLEALKMDIEDIIEKFGDKYNAEIKEMLDYVKELVDSGIISDDDNILEELYEMIGEGGSN